MHDLEAVRPEEVLNLELGVNVDTDRLALQANLYAMEFTDEIALTGELSEVGLPLRRNVDESYRRGLEVDLRWRASPGWTLLASGNLSRNRIREWTQFYDVYDETGAWVDSEPITYRDVPPLLTPEAILGLGARWAGRGVSLALDGRYVADAHLDNTGLDAFRAPSYTDVDLRASLDLGRWWPAAPARSAAGTSQEKRRRRFTPHPLPVPRSGCRRSAAGAATCRRPPCRGSGTR